MSAMFSCPAALSEPAPEDAYVKAPPRRGEKILDMIPASPIPKQMRGMLECSCRNLR
jgi:hypothetical protein